MSCIEPGRGLFDGIKRSISGGVRRILLDRFQEQNIRRICLIKPSALGDVVQTMPLLQPLVSRFPGVQISWVINSELKELLCGHPHIHEAIPFQRHGGLRGWVRLLRRLKRGRFDLTLDLQGLFRTGLMCAATAAPIRIGLETAREGAGFFCNVTIPNTGRMMPAHARYWRVAEELGKGEQPRRLQMEISEHDRRIADRLLADLPRPLLAVHPGARWETKRWPTEKFAAVIRSTIETLGAGVVILGSPAEADIAEEIECQLTESPVGCLRNLAGRTSLKQLAATLDAADLVLSNDSGPMHLAAELGKPVVGLFTCTDPVRSGPPGAQHTLLTANVPCAASYKKCCPHSGAEHLACFRELSVERVQAAVFNALDASGREALRA